MPTYKLIYFNGKGLAECVRFLMAYGKLDYEDVRLEYDETWPAKSSAYPCKRLPILDVDGKIYCQSVAICRYLAKSLNLCGNTKEDDLQIDGIVDSIVDFREVCCSYYWDKFPESKESKKPKLISETIPMYMDYLEDLAKKNNGFLAMNKLTWVDIYFVASTGYLETMCEVDLYEGKPTLKALQEKVNNLPGIKEYLAERADTFF